MELSFDWVAYQDMFHARPKAGRAAMIGGGIHVIVEGDTVVEAFAENEDLGDWVGGSVRKLCEHFKHREVARLDRAQVDRWLLEATQRAHYHEQVAGIRAEAGIETPQPFLLEGARGWWSKVAPTAFGLYLRVEGAGREKSLLVLFRRGEVEGFERPDLSGMNPAKARDPLAVAAYLSDRYRVPVQGIFTQESEWSAWNQAERPWKAVSQSIRAGKARLAPSRVGVQALLGLRSWIGV